MARSAIPLLRWVEGRQAYELSLAEGAARPVGLDDDGWLSALEEAGSFAFEGRAGRLSVIRERRARGAGYWYAYRSSGRRTRKRYLGRASSVTPARLEEVAAALSPASVTQGASDEEGSAPDHVPASLLLSKIQPPRLPGALIARPQLWQRLDAAMERKIVLLVAPVGAGKTTLAGQWLEQSPARRPLAWVALDSGDDDLYRFWRLLLTACQAWCPQATRDALSSLAGAWLPPFASPSIDEVLTTFLNDLVRQHMCAGLLVLDDYHCIRDARIHQTLSFFLQHLPDPFQVLLLTRAEPDQLPLLSWRARGQMAELHASELRLTSEETTTFVQQNFVEPLPMGAIAQLDTMLQGWIAGLRLLSFTRPARLLAEAVGHTPATREEQASDLPAIPYRPLLDYLVAEVLDTQPAPLQHLLLQLSVVERLNASLCEAMSETQDGYERLEAVVRAGLFLEALDGAWYRFHTLFLEALRREAATRLDVRERHELLLKASRWYERHGLVGEAVETSLQAAEFTRAARLIEQMGDQEELSELSTLRRWLSTMPEPVLRAHPLLCWLAALALQLSQENISDAEQRRVDSLLDMAEAAWRESAQQDLIGLLPVFHAMRSWRLGQVMPAINYARQALNHLPAAGLEESLRIFRAICLFMAGIGEMYEAQFEEARAALLEAYQIALPRKDQHFARGMLVLVAFCCYLLGELRQAHTYYQQLLVATRESGDREVLGQTLLGLATISFEWNQLEWCEQLVREALSLAPDEHGDLHHTTCLLQIQLSHAHGDLAAARQQLAELLPRLRMHPGLEAQQRLRNAELLAARLALSGGDLQSVERLLSLPILRQEEKADIMRARLLMAQGQPRQAIQLLEPLVETMQGWHPRSELQIVLALAYAASQDGRGARYWLQQALAQTSGEGLVRLFVAEGEIMAGLLRQVLPVLNEPSLRAHTQHVLSSFVSQPHARSARQPGPALTAQEIRVLQLLATGASNQQIARELVVSVNTVKDHLKHIYQKLGVSNRLQATMAYETHHQPER
ncbi:HTH-type transcriptional regulator MalT [Dictyobacter sp. S3.2.2.5]|uniref:HTH-type transcriptional regulator MalT n=1 Tax=Dictyobacter halimunensis TaxID=3026934 RepID=A0ABQ6G2Q3_9CHLR|nr:HTH-type transcriptional regulator MalT [Dictyobacter sp. S3.2.2.5]